MTKGVERPHALERARIFRRLRLSLRDLFFFHFSLILKMFRQYVRGFRKFDKQLT